MRTRLAVALLLIRCTNGYIHVIDAVLMPPAEGSGNTIVDVAVKAGN